MNKVYIITGANKGLGEAFVDLIVQKTNTVAVSISRRINDKQDEYLRTGKLLFIEQDLSKKINYSRLNKLAEIINNTTKVIFINNAGTIDPLKEVIKLRDREISDALRINVLSQVLIIKYLLQCFKNTEIQFVNISSGAANKSISNWSIYSSSKAFINRFFEILNEENKDNKKFSFKSIDPGLIDTEMQAKIRLSKFPLNHVFEEAKQKGILHTPSEVAKRILNQL